MQNTIISSNNVATVHNQENSIQTRWQPFKFNSVKDSFSAEKSRMMGIAMAVREIFINFGKLIGNLGISLGNKICTILDSRSNSAPNKTDENNIDFQNDDLATETEKAQGWTNKQKALAAIGIIGATGVALKTLAYACGPNSYAQTTWDYTFGGLNEHIVQRGFDELYKKGNTAIDELRKQGNNAYHVVCLEETLKQDGTREVIGDRCAKAGQDLNKFMQDAFCATTFGQGYSCP